MTVSELRLKLRNKIQNKIRDVAPESTRVLEVFGFFIISVGLFLALSLLTYNSIDNEALEMGSFDIKNLGGRIGALLAYNLFYYIGSVSFLWPAAILLWGSLIAFGFITRPKAKRFVAFLLISVILSVVFFIENIALVQVIMPTGYGGVMGRYIAEEILLSTIGYGGSLLFLGFAGISSLVLTRNVRFSTVGQTVEYFNYLIKKMIFRRIEEKKNEAKGNRSFDKNQVIEYVTSEFKFDNSTKNDPVKRSRKKSSKDEVAEASASESGIELELSSSVPKTAKVDLKIFAKSNLSSSKSTTNEKEIENLTTKLAEFKIEGEITNVTEGPIVTTYEFEPKAGTKISKIKALESDLSRLLRSSSLRILAPVPGKNTVGFEIPNKDKKVIRFGNIIDTPLFKSKKHILPIVMGVDTFGKPVVEDLGDMPHLLVAGSTGSGKSVFINTLLASLLSRHSSKDLRLVLFDPKMVELGAYNQAAHLACEVITDAKKDGMNLLNSLVDEMEGRYKMMNELGAKNTKHFNEIIKEKRKTAFPKFSGKWQSLPNVVVVIDEFADIMLVLGKEAEEAITRLAQKARAAGIHLVIATQRPSVQVISGLIKANFPTRVAFRVMSGVDSRTILDQMGAETLLGKGDMLYQNSTGVHRVHGAYLDEKEIDKLVKACKIK